MGRLFFINRFYWPDEPATAQLLADLAEGLAARGRRVTVITSPAPGAPRRETHRGVSVVRVGPGRHPGRGTGARALSFALFFAAACWRLAREARRGDTVVALTDPPLIGVGAGLVARARGARCYHWVQDIYPEIAVALTPHRWLAALRPFRDAAWRRADGCVTLGTDMAGALSAAGVPSARIHLVPNWAPAGVGPVEEARPAALRAAWGLEGRMIVAYSGNLGRVHDLESVLGAAEILRGEPDIVWAFIGEGAGRGALESAVRSRGLGQVRFLPRQPRADLAAVLAAADVHLVTLRADCARLVFPSKLYGIAAAGRPVVFVGPVDCEPARLVTGHGLGWAFAPADMPALAARLRRLRDFPAERREAGAAAARFAESAGGAERAVTAWDRLLPPAAA